jgi:hypothetical protein
LAVELRAARERESRPTVSVERGQAVAPAAESPGLVCLPDKDVVVLVSADAVVGWAWALAIHQTGPAVLVPTRLALPPARGPAQRRHARNYC